MKRSAAWVTSPDGTPSVSSVSQVDGAAFERVTATVANALNQIVAVNRPQSVELNGIASAMASLELQVTPQPSAQVPEPAAVVAARPPNQNRPPASGEPDGWSHWLSDSSTASFGQWPKVKVKATTQSAVLGTLVDEVEGRVWIKPDESPVYDPRGNLIQDGGWSYEWDARNRLLAAEMKAEHLPADLPQIRVEHRYDWLSRRVVTITKEKRVDTQTGARESVWRVLEHRHFWYDGWHLMAETVQGGAPGSVAAVTQRYIWGLDLAGDWERGMGQTRPQGSSTRTGGVGALLGVMTSAGKTYSVCNDANGNVMGFIDLGTATLTARFDYDAFGNPITNWSAPDHPASDTITRIRFGSKRQDPHTGWLYYGYRWYDAENGRWPSRDPIGERGGMNLYGMVYNNPINLFDPDGRAPMSGGFPTPFPSFIPPGGSSSRPSCEKPIWNPSNLGGLLLRVEREGRIGPDCDQCKLVEVRRLKSEALRAAINWNPTSPGWSKSNQCADQALALADYLNTYNPTVRKLHNHEPAWFYGVGGGNILPGGRFIPFVRNFGNHHVVKVTALKAADDCAMGSYYIDGFKGTPWLLQGANPGGNIGEGPWDDFNNDYPGRPPGG
jgi:RHS repeat-associated protein